MSTVRDETDAAVCIVTIDRPQKRNAVDGATAAALRDAFERFEADARAMKTFTSFEVEPRAGSRSTASRTRARSCRRAGDEHGPHSIRRPA